MAQKNADKNIQIQRLDKILGGLGYGSRREIALLVKQKQISIDDEICTNPASKVNAEQSHITVSGETVLWQTAFYIMLNKPAGYITATKDNFQRTVMDLLPERFQKAGVCPVGRLDKDTEGLLLLTTDGAFNHALMAPKHHVDKVYEAFITGSLAGNAQQVFEKGLVFHDGTVCKPAKLDILEKNEDDARLRITLREGKFHQVKRMVHAVGGEVVFLKRIAIGTLQLDRDLPIGGYRELTDAEVQKLLCRND